MATVTLKLKPFEVPSEVTIQMPAGLKQDGMQPLPKLKLNQLGEVELEAMIGEWVEAVMAAAKVK